jgi:septum formation protein
VTEAFVSRVLVLASASLRRRALLKSVGIPFEVDVPELDETPLSQEGAAAHVTRLAQAKAQRVAQRRPGALVLAADTTVTIEGKLLGKPQDGAEANRMLELLSGRDHFVWTAVALAGAGTNVIAVQTRVTFRPLLSEERAWYIATQEPLGKAGAYAIQGRAAAFVTAIDGSYTNVVGLPLPETLALLATAGFPLPWSRP